MHDLHRIEHALATKRLSAEVFERCAQDLLSDLFDGLTPIPGGSDWGRDADITGVDGEVPRRLLITSSRSLNGVRANMLSGIKSMNEHRVSVERIVLANPAILRLGDREKLAASAKRAGALLSVSDVFDGGFFASRLRRDGHWRAELLGLPAGPVTLSPVAPWLAESPWASLPLVARAQDLARLASAGDLILTGPPGAGKSRLLSELPGTGFVDKDAPVDSVADDLRWVRPAIVVVDDAIGAEALIRRLLWLRRTEPDLFSYRLIATCWPPDSETVQDLVPSAQVYELDLMEREPLDDLIQAMGVTGRLARGEILKQAEGRPAWAVTLADLILRKDDAWSLISGQALLGEASRYLRRSGLIPGAIDVLAIVSALGCVSELELTKLGAELRLHRTDIAAVLNTVARSGLVDVRAGYAGGPRTYAVRPPMLADALVAERAFAPAASAIDFRGLADRWPERTGELAGAAITSALLGAPRTRQLAETLLDEALRSQVIPAEAKTHLCLEFMRLDRQAGNHVLRLAREFLNEVIAASETSGWELEGAVSQAARAAWLYEMDPAIDLLLDASVADHRRENSHPYHPLRQLESLVHGFHPEVPRQPNLRRQIAACTSRWLAQAPEDPVRLQVAASIMRIVLSLGIRATVPHPGRPDEWNLIDTIVPATEIREVSNDIWPILEQMLSRDRPALAAAAIDMAAEWLRIGDGHDHPFGRDHPQDTIAAAREAGTALAGALARREDLSTGNRARLRSAVGRFDVGVAVHLPKKIALFFADIETLSENLLEAETILAEIIRTTVDAWASDEPVHVIATLSDIKAELTYAQQSWPDRPLIATTRLAEVVADPVAWLHASISRGFMPEGCRFAQRLVQEGRLSEEDTRSLLTVPTSRAEIIGILLAGEPPLTSATELAAQALTSNDFTLLRLLMLQGRLAPRRQRALLTQADPMLRATAAIAIFSGRRFREDWDPGELEPPLLAALGSLQPSRIPGCSGEDMARLFKYLAGRYPDTLTGIITRALSEAGESGSYRSLPLQCWHVIHLLPTPNKLKLWRRFQDQPSRKWLLHSHMLGPDIGWLEELLATNEMSPNEALSCYIAIRPGPPIEKLAKLLVPQGIDPERIAALRGNGTWSGSFSSWHQANVRSFEAMSDDEDPSVKAVAEAGIRLFTAEREQAARHERIERIRGAT
jgi:hypothetical protein